MPCALSPRSTVAAGAGSVKTASWKNAPLNARHTPLTAVSLDASASMFA